MLIVQSGKLTEYVVSELMSGRMLGGTPSNDMAALLNESVDGLSAESAEKKELHMWHNHAF